MTDEVRRMVDGLRIAFTTSDTSGGKSDTDNLVYKSDVVELVEKLTKWNKVEDFPIPKETDVIVKMENGEYGHAKYFANNIGVIDGHFDFDMPNVTDWKLII